jgi:hypothetical protein
VSAATLRRIALAGVLLAAGAPRPAAAFNVITCSNEPVVWSVSMWAVRSTVSFPPGSTAEHAFFNAVNQWNDVRGMVNVINVGGTTSGNITHGDDQSDVLLVSPASIQGNPGLTMIFAGICWPWGADLDEADVMVANNQTFDNPKENGLSVTGRDTLLHEFGHAIGLDHEEKDDIMRAAGAVSRVGGPGEHIDVLADDAAGGRFLYPFFQSKANLYASAQRLENGSITNDQGATPQLACPGGTVFLNFTVGNNGTVTVVNNQRFSMHPDLFGYTGGTTMGNWNNATNPAGTVFSGTASLTVPNVSPGKYRLFYRVDKDSTTNESKELDNVVRLNKTLQVLDCN